MNFEGKTNLNFIFMSGTIKYKPTIRKNSFNKLVTFIQVIQDINRNKVDIYGIMFNEKLAELVYSNYKQGDYISFQGVLRVIKDKLTIIGTNLAYDPNKQGEK